jgi:hypothetical protein
MGRTSKQQQKQQGGKKTRKAPKAIGQWVSFVKKVAAEEGIKYNKAMKRASERSAAGEKWQTGGNAAPEAAPAAAPSAEPAVQQTTSSIVHSAASITSSPPSSGGEPTLNTPAPVPMSKGGRRKTSKKYKKKCSK